MSLNLPAYEADTLGWIAEYLRTFPPDDQPYTQHGVETTWGEMTKDSPGIRAEVVAGEEAVLIRFPNGGERLLYLDDRPHGEHKPHRTERLLQRLQRAEEAEEEEAEARREAEDHAETLESDLDAMEAERDEARAMIESARKLLADIRAADEEEASKTAWLQERLRELDDVLH